MDKTDIRVISLPCDTGACGHVRIRQPFKAIKKLTGSDTHVIDPKDDDMTAIAQAVNISDVLIARPGGEEGVKRLLNYPEYKNKPWVLDIDDNLLEISPYSPHYGANGTKEFYDKESKKWIWKDGANIDIKLNKLRQDWHIWGLRNASMVTVTTEVLAKFARKFNKNVKVLPNCINTNIWWKLDTKPHKQLRVIWSGGVSHYEDWYSIKKPLNSLMKEYQFKLVMIGADFSGLIDEENKHLLELRPEWVPYEGHSYRMMCMDADLAIIPLADLPFNSYKSSLKWYEMSAMGIPSVVSWVSPYKDDVPKNACLRYTNPNEFIINVARLLNSAELRKEMGLKAQKWVRENRDSEKNANLWLEAYKSIVVG